MMKAEESLLPATTTSSRSDAPDPALSRLATAVLIQALEDLTRGPKRRREEALNWMLGKTTEGFSFDFCCGLLGREPDDVLQRVQSYLFPPTGLPISGVSYTEPLSYFLK